MVKLIKTACVEAMKTEDHETDVRKWLRVENPDTVFFQKEMKGHGSTQVMMGQTTDIKNYSREGVALRMAVQALGGGGGLISGGLPGFHGTSFRR